MITSQIAVLIHFQIVRMRTFGPDLNVDQKRICDAFLTRDNEIFGFSGPKIFVSIFLNQHFFGFKIVEPKTFGGPKIFINQNFFKPKFF